MCMLMCHGKDELMILLLDFISCIQPCIECLSHSGLNLYNLTCLSLLNVDLVWLEAEV